MTPAEQKEAEANGASLREVKSEVSSNSSCEDIAPFQKRSRRKECIFITIAVVLGAGLIAVLVYFSVTNALKEDEPIARGSQGEDSTSTTPDYGQNYDYQTGDDYNSVDPGTSKNKNVLTRGGPQTRDASGGDSSPGGHLRSLPAGPEARSRSPPGETGSDEPTGPLLRAGPLPPASSETEGEAGPAIPMLRTMPKPSSGESSPGETGNTDSAVPLEKSSRTLLRGSDASSMVDNTDADTGEGTQTDDASSTGDNTGADTGEGTQTEEAGGKDVSNFESMDRSQFLRGLRRPPPPLPSTTEEKKEEQTEK